MKNILLNYPLSPLYYLKHPLKFFRQVGFNIHYIWERATKGYCYLDMSNFAYWFLEIAPDMLNELANEPGYPYDPEFPTYEHWQEWLHKQAATLISCREEEIEKENEYEEQYFNLIPDINSNRLEDSEIKELRKKYLDRATELFQEQQTRIKTALTEISKHWFALWS